MKLNDVFPSRFLSHDDLDGELCVTIERVHLEEMQRPGTREKVTKPVVDFAEMDKGLVVNKTNWMRIAAQHGDESDAWAGKQIVLAVERVRFGAEMVEAIRVKPGNRRANGAPVASVRFSGDWRDQVIHFGKNRGTRLGDTPRRALEWYQKEWQPRADTTTGSYRASDLQLRAALDASLREPVPAGTEAERPLPSAGGDDDVPF